MLGEYVQTTRSPPEATDGRLSLFVVAGEDGEAAAADSLDPVADLAWLQFIDGLDLFVVVESQREFFDTVAADHDSPDSGLWLVDEVGTVHRQWALPSERGEVLAIGRTVERTIDTRGDAT